MSVLTARVSSGFCSEQMKSLQPDSWSGRRLMESLKALLERLHSFILGSIQSK